MTAPQAAGVIHSDFEKGFIRAETMSYNDLIEKGSEALVKEAGLLRYILISLFYLLILLNNFFYF